jgi:hypothetical protein
MKRKLIVAFSATLLLIVIAIGIAANCGSTWMWDVFLLRL